MDNVIKISTEMINGSAYEIYMELPGENADVPYYSAVIGGMVSTGFDNTEELFRAIHNNEAEFKAMPRNN